MAYIDGVVIPVPTANREVTATTKRAGGPSFANWVRCR